ncbi:hypothetical protein Tco_1234204 [Tanacetum coccineum]
MRQSSLSHLVLVSASLGLHLVSAWVHVESVVVHLESALVFSTWMAFRGNTRDLGSFREEMDEITDLHQILEEVLLTEHGDGIASIKRCRRDLFSEVATTSRS